MIPMSDEVSIKQMPAFKKAYKRLHKKQKIKVNSAIRDIVENPGIGREKKGDLAGIFVHKIKLEHQEILIAYEWSVEERMLLALGVHENFYRDLKKQIN